MKPFPDLFLLIDIYYSIYATFRNSTSNWKSDILGREVEGNKNEPLFYIYDDGTVEKRIVIE